MLKSCIVFFILLVCLHSQNPVSLSSTDFKNTVSSNKFVLVMFFSPDCGHCKQFKPEYQKLPEMLADMGVVVADVNCVDNVEVCEEEGVTAYPTTHFYVSGEKLAYENARTAEAVTSWIKRYQEKRINDVKKDELESLKVPYVLYNGKDDQMRKILDKVSFIYQHVPFYKIQEEGANKLTVMNSKNIQMTYEGEFEKEKVQSWILENTLPSIIPLSSHEFVSKVLVQSPFPSLFIIVASDADYEHPTHALISDYCDEHKGKIICGEVTKSNQIFEGSHSYLRQEDTKKSVVSVVKNELKVAFVCNQPYTQLTKQKLDKFVQEAIAETIQPVVNDRVPTQIAFKDVKVLKGEQFEDFIKNHENVFVNFYSPEDEPSLRLYPRYETLKSQIDEDKDVNVEVVAIDCKEFESKCEEKLVDFYPTLRLYIKGLSVDFEAEMGIPEVPSLYSFILSRVKAETANIQKKEQMKQLPKPSLLFVGPQKTDVIELFPKIVNNIQCFFLKSEGDYHIQLHTDQKIVHYEGEFLIRQIEDWIEAQKGPLLSDMMADTPDSRIINAVKNRKFILFLLDTEKDHRQSYRQSLGEVCKSLKYVCGYAEGEHPGFSSLAEWIGFQEQNLKKATLIYADIGSDKKYLYPHGLDELTKENLNAFCDSVKNGEIEEIPQKDEKFSTEGMEEEMQDVVQEGEEQSKESEDIMADL